MEERGLIKEEAALCQDGLMVMSGVQKEKEKRGEKRENMARNHSAYIQYNKS